MLSRRGRGYTIGWANGRLLRERTMISEERAALLTTNHPSDELFSLRGRVAVVTGASRNIGAAIARSFADAGADLLLVARGEERLKSVADEIRRKSGRHVETVALDVAERSAGEAILAHADRHLPPVTILVNNAFATGEVAGVFESPVTELGRKFLARI